MDGPISITTITGGEDDQPTGFVDVRVSIEFPVSLSFPKDGEPLDFDLMAKSLEDDTWRDGREDFPVELIKHGLESLLKKAIFYCLDEKLAEKYGRNTMVTNEEGTSSYNKAYYAAQEALKEYDPFIRGGIAKAEVRIETEEERR